MAVVESDTMIMSLSSITSRFSEPRFVELLERYYSGDQSFREATIVVGKINIRLNIRADNVGVSFYDDDLDDFAFVIFNHILFGPNAGRLSGPSYFNRNVNDWYCTKEEFYDAIFGLSTELSTWLLWNQLC